MTSEAVANRLGFIILGLTNNFAYVIMLSAAYDLLKQTEDPKPDATGDKTSLNFTDQKYCNEHSTSTILLADTIPSLTTKLIYPFMLVGIPTAYKAIATALLSAASFLVTGLFTSQVLIFTGVAFASFSSGLGESTYLSNTPLYGDVSLSGWSMGTGGAGIFGAIAYALLRIVLSIKLIMILMLVIPVAMMVAYFKIIVPVQVVDNTASTSNEPTVSLADVSGSSANGDQSSPVEPDLRTAPTYGAAGETRPSEQTIVATPTDASDKQPTEPGNFNMWAKIHYLPTLSKYFMPLLLVYFAEYFINQGLFELVYYPEISFLDKAAQYRWFQVSYQLGVMISRSSLDLIIIKQLWTMSLLQTANAVLFLAHASKLIHIPSFYIVVLIIVYEGLLGGFTYANTFCRMKKELPPDKQEFGISTVTIADTLGIVIAGAVALPVHDALCKLYNP